MDNDVKHPDCAGTEKAFNKYQTFFFVHMALSQVLGNAASSN